LFTTNEKGDGMVQLFDAPDSEWIETLGERLERAIRAGQQKPHPAPEVQIRSMSEAFGMLQRRLSMLAEKDRAAVLAAINREISVLCVVASAYADILDLESCSSAKRAA